MNRKDILNSLIPTTLLTAAGLVAGAVANRLQLHIGHDAGEYIGMLSQIARGEWSSVHFIWPPGFALLGLPFVWAGFTPDMALFTVQLFSFATIVVLTWFIMAGTVGPFPLRTSLLLVLALAPVMHSVMYDFRSELPFAALILILVWIPWPWKNASRALAIGMLITALFLVRYVGLAFVLFPALAWFIIRPAKFGTGKMTILATLSACALILLYIAAVAHAPVAGYALGGYYPNLDVLTHASDFGLSLLGIIGKHAHLYLTGPLRIAVGLMLLALLAFILAVGMRSVHTRVKLLALCAALYVVALIALRSVYWFDALSGPRFAVPALPAIIAILGSLHIKQQWLVHTLLTGIVLLIALQLVQLVR